MKKIGIVLYVLFGCLLTSYTQTTWEKTTEELIVADPPFQQCHAAITYGTPVPSGTAYW